mgnify:CR=1 FL=1
MGSRGRNNKSYALWEELNLRVSNEVGKVAIYKKTFNDTRDGKTPLPIEERGYYIHIPVPNTKGGIRKSLRTPNRDDAIELANELFINVKVDLKSGNSIIPVPVEDVVEKFLLYKKSLIRGKWESKKEGGRKSITNERYILIAGKLRNYLTGFLGKKTDARSIPYKKWNGWEMWRKDNNKRKEMGNPKASTIQNEMGLIRECWSWGMTEGYIPVSLKLPFANENLIGDDKVSRDTWEASEWNSFARRVRDWLNTTASGDDDYVWDAFVAYQMLFLLANSGIRTGELMKVKRKDIKFYKADNSLQKHKQLCCLIQIHPSTKTGGREVNAMGGEFARRVYDKSKFKKKEDFLFCHLDGTPFTTKQFRDWFYKMTEFTDENERWGKVFQPYGIRHFYATTRLQNGTSTYTLCENMGVTEPYLRKHYSKYLNRLATADLMKMNNDIGLGGKIIPDGEDFLIPEIK